MYHRLNTNEARSPSKHNWSHSSSTIVELTSQGSVVSESPSENSACSGSDEEYSDARSICSTDSSYYISTNDNVVGNQSECSTYAPEDVEVQDSSLILATLQLHLEEEKETQGQAETKKRRQMNFLNDVEALNVEELQRLKETLEDHIYNTNMELVDELKTRDSLYSQHQALLMEAEDASNIGVCREHEVERPNNNVPQIHNSSGVRKKERKRWSLWW